MKNKFLLAGIPIITILPIIPAIVLTGEVAKPRDPSTDSWEDFLEFAKDEEKFKLVYHVDSFESLIGKWDNTAHTVPTLIREIPLNNGPTVKVRLIGVNHDTISGTNKKATFTFEFVDCLYGEITYGTNPKNITWENSDVRTMCEYFYGMLPEDIKQIIKPVDKQTFEYREDSKDENDGVMVTTSEHFFLPSYFEVAAEEDLSDPVKPLEGTPYELYNAALYEPGGYCYDNEVIRKKTVIGDEWQDPATYWLRSPFWANVSSYGRMPSAGAVSSQSEGAAAAYYCINHLTGQPIKYAFCPCFCV